MWFEVVSRRVLGNRTPSAGYGADHQAECYGNARYHREMCLVTRRLSGGASRGDTKRPLQRVRGSPALRRQIAERIPSVPEAKGARACDALDHRRHTMTTVEFCQQSVKPAPGDQRMKGFNSDRAHKATIDIDDSFGEDASPTQGERAKPEGCHHSGDGDDVDRRHDDSDSTRIRGRSAPTPSTSQRRQLKEVGNAAHSRGAAEVVAPPHLPRMKSSAGQVVATTTSPPAVASLPTKPRMGSWREQRTVKQG